MSFSNRLTTIVPALALALVSATPIVDVPHTARPTVREPRHVALLIGISDYKVLGREPDAVNHLTDLDGPGNDVVRMGASLLQWGFTDTANVHVLPNAAASKEGIARGFEWVRERASDSSDVVVIFFSGHGSSVPDQNGDEKDGRDEALVPYDAAKFTEPSQVVIDDSIGVWLGRLATHNVTMIVDACFSGSVTRGGNAHVKGIPSAVGGAIAGAVLDPSETRLGHTLITASRSFETAQEREFPDGSKQWTGVLTYHLTRILDGASATRGLRYDDLMGMLRQAVYGDHMSQIPQIDGDSVSPLFRSHTGVASRAFALVTSQSGNQVTLGVGALNGVRQSAVYDVYGSTETRFAGGRLARVRVDSVLEMTSRGRIVDEQGAPVTAAPRLPASARAVLALVPLGVTDLPALRVFVASSARDLSGMIKAMDSITIVVTPDSIGAHAVVTRARGVLEVFAGGIPLPPQTPERGAPPNPQRVVAGDTIMGYTDSTLCGPLTRAFAIAKLTELRNSSPPPDLRAYVRVVPSGTQLTGKDTLVLADTVRIGTTSAPARVDVLAYISVPEGAVARTRLYVSGAIAGYASDPYVFWPERQEPSPFPLNVWKPLWSGVQLSPPAGPEMIKVTVNSDQYDLRSIVNAAQLCRSRGIGQTNAKGFDQAADSVTGWTAVSRTVQILPPKR